MCGDIYDSFADLYGPDGSEQPDEAALRARVMEVVRDLPTLSQEEQTRLLYFVQEAWEREEDEAAACDEEVIDLLRDAQRLLRTGGEAKLSRELELSGEEAASVLSTFALMNRILGEDAAAWEKNKGGKAA